MPAPQAMPQPPQLLGSLLVSVHVPLQSVCPDGQPPPPLATQVPLEQVVPEPHTLPQLPQLLGSLARVTQAPAHSTVPDGQLITQVPPAHTVPAVHT
jgi:hypothetical protein